MSPIGPNILDWLFTQQEKDVDPKPEPNPEPPNEPIGWPNIYFGD